jgi:hypothetical protein
MLKRSRNQIFFLKKSMKILIRKAKTENSLKKDILTSLTLSKNSVKTKNVFSIITLFSASPRDS